MANLYVAVRSRYVDRVWLSVIGMSQWKNAVIKSTGYEHLGTQLVACGGMMRDILGKLNSKIKVIIIFKIACIRKILLKT
jgi:hypothetical protein